MKYSKIKDQAKSFVMESPLATPKIKEDKVFVESNSQIKKELKENLKKESEELSNKIYKRVYTVLNYEKYDVSSGLRCLLTDKKSSKIEQNFNDEIETIKEEVKNEVTKDVIDGVIDVELDKFVDDYCNKILNEITQEDRKSNNSKKDD